MMDGVSVTPEKSAPDKLYLMPAKEVAVGLTGMDGEMLERIGPQEIEGGAWMKRGEKVREGEGSERGREGGRQRGSKGGRKRRREKGKNERRFNQD